MCVLHRSFGIKKMMKRGLRPIIARDLVKAIYNPAMRPYVSWGEGNKLMYEFIEKFYCPSIESGQIKE
jgi:hypothetical protein